MKYKKKICLFLRVTFSTWDIVSKNRGRINFGSVKKIIKYEKKNIEILESS